MRTGGWGPVYECLAPRGRQTLVCPGPGPRARGGSVTQGDGKSLAQEPGPGLGRGAHPESGSAHTLPESRSGFRTPIPDPSPATRSCCWAALPRTPSGQLPWPLAGGLAPAGFGPRIQSGRSVMDKENQQLQAGCVACPVEEECQDAVSHPLIFQVWLGSLCGYRNA